MSTTLLCPGVIWRLFVCFPRSRCIVVQALACSGLGQAKACTTTRNSIRVGGALASPTALEQECAGEEECSERGFGDAGRGGCGLAEERGVDQRVVVEVDVVVVVQVAVAVAGAAFEEAAVEAVWRGETVAPAAELATTPVGRAGLSARETEVLELICHGLSNLEIAEQLFVSVNSVKTYVRQIYQKIGVTRRAQAVAWGLANGF